MDKIKRIISFKKTILSSKNFWKIFTVNLISPLLLFIGIFCFNKYQESIIYNSLNNMKVQANLIATAINEGAVDRSLIKRGNSEQKSYWIKNYSAQRIVEKASTATGVNIRLFNKKGERIALSENSFEGPKLSDGFLDKSVKFINKATTSHYDKFKTEPWKKIEGKETAKNYPEVMEVLKEKIQILNLEN